MKRRHILKITHEHRIGMTPLNFDISIDISSLSISISYIFFWYNNNIVRSEQTIIVCTGIFFSKYSHSVFFLFYFNSNCYFFVDSIYIYIARATLFHPNASIYSINVNCMIRSVVVVVNCVCVCVYSSVRITNKFELVFILFDDCGCCGCCTSFFSSLDCSQWCSFYWSNIRLD